MPYAPPRRGFNAAHEQRSPPRSSAPVLEDHSQCPGWACRQGGAAYRALSPSLLLASAPRSQTCATSVPIRNPNR